MADLQSTRRRRVLTREGGIDTTGISIAAQAHRSEARSYERGARTFDRIGARAFEIGAEQRVRQAQADAAGRTIDRAAVEYQTQVGGQRVVFRDERGVVVSLPPEPGALSIYDRAYYDAMASRTVAAIENTARTQFVTLANAHRLEPDRFAEMADAYRGAVIERLPGQIQGWADDRLRSLSVSHFNQLTREKANRDYQAAIEQQQIRAAELAQDLTRIMASTDPISRGPGAIEGAPTPEVAKTARQWHDALNQVARLEGRSDEWVAQQKERFAQATIAVQATKGLSNISDPDELLLAARDLSNKISRGTFTAAVPVVDPDGNVTIEMVSSKRYSPGERAEMAKAAMGIAQSEIQYRNAQEAMQRERESLSAARLTITWSQHLAAGKDLTIPDVIDAVKDYSPRTQAALISQGAALINADAVRDRQKSGVTADTILLGQATEFLDTLNDETKSAIGYTGEARAFVTEDNAANLVSHRLEVANSMVTRANAVVRAQKRITDLANAVTRYEEAASQGVAQGAPSKDMVALQDTLFSEQLGAPVTPQYWLENFDTAMVVVRTRAILPRTLVDAMGAVASENPETVTKAVRLYDQAVRNPTLAAHLGSDVYLGSKRLRAVQEARRMLQDGLTPEDKTFRDGIKNILEGKPAGESWGSLPRDQREVIREQAEEALENQLGGWWQDAEFSADAWREAKLRFARTYADFDLGDIDAEEARTHMAGVISDMTSRGIYGFSRLMAGARQSQDPDTWVLVRNAPQRTTGYGDADKVLTTYMSEQADDWKRWNRLGHDLKPGDNLRLEYGGLNNAGHHQYHPVLLRGIEWIKLVGEDGTRLSIDATELITGLPDSDAWRAARTPVPVAPALGTVNPETARGP